ncbi:peptidylprolyl isomerase [Paucibacter sp. PLA-PC-4]|uniref:peptidylprolyl isomerase n=1 Tax=Paucibacter sp. PLA-PC-4 TaxID=2993655 RepID=UPI002248EA44|nr:peptidylprolyl isomerase [Paucibacter sp. PLA-PC-4]MCX2862344.1 peptidylprolyl isomerase [Paucibacter sp. PLA-PC-4]
MNLIKTLCATSALTLLAACGGGGSSGDDNNVGVRPKPNPNPTAPTTSCSAAGIAASTASPAANTVCMLTSKGEIVIELETAKAPITVANFLKYVQDGYYSNTIFHRVVPNFVVQGGGFTTGFVAKPGVGSAIKLESNVGLSNVRGTIAMARTTAADSATSQFYFNTVNNTGLDYKSAAEPGYAVFGRVISGLGTVDAINAEPQLPVANAETPATEVLLYWAIKLK